MQFILVWREFKETNPHQRGYNHKKCKYRVGSFKILVLKNQWFRKAHIYMKASWHSCQINFYTPVLRRDILCYGVVRASVRGHFSFPDFFLLSLELLHWNFVYCFVVKSYGSSSRFSVIDSFLQELCSLNFEEFKNFSVFRTFFCHLCRYKIETWFIVL
jgi:hypothetical protein